MRALCVLLPVLLCAGVAHADSLASAAGSSVLAGAYTVATLPDPAKNQARYAFVSDLGGGADMVLSDGAYWKHIRQGVVTNVAAMANISVTPLASPPIMQLTGNAVAGSVTINLQPANLYPGYTLHVVVPTGVLSTVAGLLGTVGVGVGGGSTLPVLGGTWEDLQWNGSTLVEIGRGTL